MTDYPAAHSMDTTWFAVDADGNVGRFETGEDGAVPNDAALGGGGAEPTFDVFLLDAACAAHILATPSEDRKRTAPFDRPACAVVVLAAVGKDYRSTPTATALPKQSAVLREANPRIVATEQLSIAELDALARDPDVREVWTDGELWDLLDGMDRGLYQFGNQDYGNPGAYARERTPEKPMTLADLPEPLRKDVGAVALPIRFADAESVHLADLMKDEDAQTWGDTGLRGDKVPPPRPPVVKRPVDWRRIAILLLAVLGIAWLLSRK